MAVTQAIPATTPTAASLSRGMPEPSSSLPTTTTNVATAKAAPAAGTKVPRSRTGARAKCRFASRSTKAALANAPTTTAPAVHSRLPVANASKAPRRNAWAMD